MKLECYLDPIVIQVVMQLEVKQHCRCTCIVAAVGYCAERAKDGTTLKEEFQFVEAKKADKRSDGHLLQTQGVDAAFSQYHHA